jgi:hypothetical protein
MVRVGAPCFSLQGIGPLRKKRNVYPPTPAVPAVEHVNVTAGSPTPSPDCTGTYNQIEDYGSLHCYQKTTAPFFYLFRSKMMALYFISPIQADFPDNGWMNTTDGTGEYYGIGTYTGIAIASTPIT